MTIFDLTNDDQAGVELVEAVLAIRSRLDRQSAELAQLKATVAAQEAMIGKLADACEEAATLFGYLAATLADARSNMNR